LDRRRIYILTLALLLVASTLALSASRESRLDVYISVFAIDYFVASTVLRPRRRTFDFIGVALLVAFAFIVALRFVEILME